LYTYDAAYQLLTKSVAGTPKVTNTWSPNGSLATSTTPTGTQTYTTDLTDELISLTLENGSTVGYTADVQGNRTSRTVNGLLDATWAWDDLSSLPTRIGEYDPAGTLTTGWLADPTSSTGASLAQTSGGSSSWLLSDPFANTVATVSTTGNTVSGTRTMDAFGVQRTTATGSLANASVGFAGQYLDTATGLYDMRARDYDPTSGRFTATDPVAVPTGMPYVAGYSYAYSNSLMFSDASGLKPLGQSDYADGGSYRPGVDTSAPAPIPGQTMHGCALVASKTIGRWAVEIGYETMKVWLADDLSKYFLGYSNKSQLNTVVNCALSLNIYCLMTNAEEAYKLIDMRVHFKPSGPWDVKPILVHRMGLPGDSFDPTRYLNIGRGQTMYYDVIGNVQYGYMMSRFGFTQETAIRASKAPGSGNPDSADDVAIKIGYAMRTALGDNFTANDMYNFILNTANKQALVGAGKIHGNAN